MAAASIAPHGGTPAARREQRQGFAGRREKQEAGLTPDRAGWAGQADGAPHIWPVTKRGGLYPQEQRHPTPVAEKDLSPPSRGGPYAEEDKARSRRRGGRCPSQQVRTMPRQAMEGLYPVSRGGRYQEEDKHHTPAQGEGPTR